MNLAGCLTSFTAVMGYGWVQHQWTPCTKDFLDYLEAQAMEDDHDQWLWNKINEFKHIWSIDNTLSEALHD